LLDAAAKIRITNGGSNNQIDRPCKEPFQRILKAEKGGCVVAGLKWLKLHQEIEIAVLGIESAAQSRTKKFQPKDVKFAAESRQLRMTRGNNP